MIVAFDTLGASKRLRDAGLEERAAEAIVELVQSTAQFPDISGLATKTDIADMATKADIADMATKADLTELAHATKADLAELAHTTKMDIQALKADLAITKTQILVELNDKLRSQTLGFLGGVTAIVGLATAIIKLAP
ncbi:hypothetical protein [Caulobacter sp.]|uniref:hypothetical protein n=1 Tax=Caulobacter sp. TaxID=78 RepID=UPI003BB0F81D